MLKGVKIFRFGQFTKYSTLYLYLLVSWSFLESWIFHGSISFMCQICDIPVVPIKYFIITRIDSKMLKKQQNGNGGNGLLSVSDYLSTEGLRTWGSLLS